MSNIAFYNGSFSRRQSMEWNQWIQIAYFYIFLCCDMLMITGRWNLFKIMLWSTFRIHIPQKDLPRKITYTELTYCLTYAAKGTIKMARSSVK